MQDEQRTELSASLLGSLMERSKVPAISGIDWAVILDQQGSHIHMLKGGGGTVKYMPATIVCPAHLHQTKRHCVEV